jgi:hypothetical protein
MMINRALKEKSFPIPEDACVHDWWIALVASSFGIIDFISIPTVKYRQHDKNQIGARKYGIHHFINRLKNIDSLIDEFHASILQATALYQRYKNSLNDEQKKIILAFINLEKKNIIERKITILRYKFFKQDFFRTIGLIGLV